MGILLDWFNYINTTIMLSAIPVLGVFCIIVSIVFASLLISNAVKDYKAHNFDKEELIPLGIFLFSILVLFFFGLLILSVWYNL